MKLANLRQLAEASPGTQVVVTWNARANRPMIDVNEALGCRVVSVGRDVAEGPRRPVTAACMSMRYIV